MSNRPFDTTKGHIGASKLKVKALNPMASPKEFYSSTTVFMGDIDEAVFDAQEDFEVLLMTLTDNGGGGQPVSMHNYKALADRTHDQGKLVWVDGCRIFENALFIKAFDDAYAEASLVDIAKEILAEADVVTMSLKKMYAHSGGAILINRNSKVLSEEQVAAMGVTIKRQTTTDYGNGYRSYSGLMGDGMVEIITGLMCAVDEEVVGKRIAQCGMVGCYLKDRYDFPIIHGGHALYIAADQVLPNVALAGCPAEYLNAILMKALQIRGCGLGYLVYGQRTTVTDSEEEGENVVFKNKLNMDSLRLAVPRCEYDNEQMIAYLSVVGEAYAKGRFQELKGGLSPIAYVDNGFYHFGGKYDFLDEAEFKEVTVDLHESAEKA